MWSQANVAEHGRISGGFADGGGAVVVEGEAALRSFSSARSSRGIIDPDLNPDPEVPLLHHSQKQKRQMFRTGLQQRSHKIFFERFRLPALAVCELQSCLQHEVCQSDGDCDVGRVCKKALFAGENEQPQERMHILVEGFGEYSFGPVEI